LPTLPAFFDEPKLRRTPINSQFLPQLRTPSQLNMAGRVDEISRCKAYLNNGATDIFARVSSRCAAAEKKRNELCFVISSFRLDAAESCILLGYDAASSGKFLPTFRDVSIGCPETSVSNYHNSLHNNPEECSSQLGFVTMFL